MHERQAAWLATGSTGRAGVRVPRDVRLIAFGTGSVAMSVAALNRSDRGSEAFQASGDWLLIAFGWGFAVAFAV